MSGLSKGLRKIEVALRWDPSPSGTPANDLDIVAATYTADAPHGEPAYLVHFDSRSPDGTITLNRDSRTGLGFGADEVMTLELDRLSTSYIRVVVGVAIQQREGRKTFGEVANTDVRFRENGLEFARYDFSDVGASTAVKVAEFTRDNAGAWEFRQAVRGFDTEPAAFAGLMGGPAA
ncbi:TerD family protein [Streptomyces sp. XD-27]|uniref:TerD family protein n=1 Tax=Streptomyces sp. XD-27 TaxID=3062779 RepID=UPI0026F43211|nr:TerD family protein [Streptomyces sp. XD-27]WKX68960.1 TerD family protein [Streptomyces sp. XD-27]